MFKRFVSNQYQDNSPDGHNSHINCLIRGLQQHSACIILLSIHMYAQRFKEIWTTSTMISLRMDKIPIQNDYLKMQSAIAPSLLRGS